MEIKVGDKLKIYYHPGNPSNRELEVRAIVDEDYVVCRKRQNGGFIYSVEKKDLLLGLANHGNLTRFKR